MNPDTGKFHKIDGQGLVLQPAKLKGMKAPKEWPVFTIGEELDFNGIKCKIEKVSHKDLYLKLPTNDQMLAPSQSIVKIKDREMVVRKYDFDVVVVRPVIGCINRY